MYRTIFATMMFLLLCLPAQAQGIITTIAGTGVAGHSGDGGPATDALLSAPHKIWVDARSNIYVADHDNNSVRKITAATGIISNVAGNGINGCSGDGLPAIYAMLSAMAICTDVAGNTYIADHEHDRIRRVDGATGIISTFAGSTGGYSGDGGPATDAAIYIPTDICFDHDGNMLIAESGNHIIRRISASGIISTVAGTGTLGFTGDGGPATNAQLGTVDGVRVGSNGDLYINDQGNKRIRKVSAATGIITTIAGTGAFDTTGNGGPATAAATECYALALDRYDNVYIADLAMIRRIDVATGIISRIAGTGEHGYSGDGGLAIDAQVFAPTGLHVDTSGNIYISDGSNNVIRKIWAHATGVTAMPAYLYNAALYPMPVKDVLHISEPQRYKNGYRIVDMTGSLIAQGISNDAIPMQHIAAGLYLLELTGADGALHRFKVVKE